MVGLSGCYGGRLAVGGPCGGRREKEVRGDGGREVLVNP